MSSADATWALQLAATWKRRDPAWALERVFALLFFSVKARKRRFPDFPCDSSEWRLGLRRLDQSWLSCCTGSSEQKTPARQRARLSLVLKSQHNTSSACLRQLLFSAISRIHLARHPHTRNIVEHTAPPMCRSPFSPFASLSSETCALLNAQ